MLPFLLSAFLFAAAPTPAAPSINGAWMLNGEVSGVAYAAKCTFTLTDAVISGTCGDDQGTHPLKGKVDGDKITFSLDSTYNNDPITMNYTGKVGTDGKLTGSVEVEPYGVDGTFTATRPAEPAAK